MKVYLTRASSPQIDEIEADRISENSVWVNGRSRVKRSDYFNYWGTYEEAKQHLIDSFNKSIMFYKEQIERIESKLNQLK